MANNCKECGAALSEAVELPAKHSYCANCWKDKQQHQQRSALFGLALYVGVGLLIVLVFRGNGFGWMLLNIALLYVLSVLAVVLHELGHAIASRSVGMRVQRLVIGTGTTFWQIRLFGAWIILRVFPFGGGHVVATHPALNWVRLRHAVFVLAGPMTNLSIAIMLSCLTPETALRNWPANTYFYPTLVFIAANLVAFVVSLYPKHYITEEGNQEESDGLQLLRLPFRKADDFSSHVAAHYLLPGAECLAIKDYAGTRQAALNGLQAYRTLDLVRAHLLNQVAWSDLLDGTMKLPEESLAFASEALRLAPDDIAIKGTLGSLLVESGQYEKGLTLLLDSNAGVKRSTDRALNLCYVAIAHKQLGNTGKADDVIHEIQTLDPDCLLLQRARGIVG
ncbi:MAG: site-2 protease family protein [Gammaproteobacteria bacterium]|nr:site-2 protease family protein [Gammaproteobacteria bacterium]